MKHPFLKYQPKKAKKANRVLKRYTARLRHLLTNNNHLLEENYQLELLGLLDMVSGLEYHYRNFKKIEKACRKRYKKTFEDAIFYSIPSKNVIHEMVAYMNRCGQIFYLFKSEWFSRQIKVKDLAYLCPEFLALLPFRHKFASHRSIDMSRGETPHEQANQASLRAAWVGTFSKDDIKNGKGHDWDKMNIQYQMLVTEKKDKGVEKVTWPTFIPAKHHNIVCDEIIRVIEEFINKVNQSL